MSGEWSDSRELPTEKVDDLAWVHGELKPINFVTESTSAPFQVVVFEGKRYHTDIDKQVKRYGGRSRMRVVDSAEEALQIKFDDSDNCLLPELFVLSPNTYCAMMQQPNALQFLSHHPATLYGIPYVINKRIR